MRGAHTKLHRIIPRIRIIPADAGSTLTSIRSKFQLQDHPRGCGEHSNSKQARFSNSGSSPRMRGALRLAAAGKVIARIIPADAGSTPRASLTTLPGRDHPRGCGEHPFDGCIALRMVGSSPRMRGAQLQLIKEHIVHGIIPADAGSTPSRGRNASPTQDHPRGCGEHEDRLTNNNLRTGSSPRMRGARGTDLWCLPRGRIIPADAGSTVDATIDTRGYEDHPRGCGEHLTPYQCNGLSSGSSPRMRGAQFRYMFKVEVVRIIPADAGSTHGEEQAMTSLKDHPRGCGEHATIRCQAGGMSGSSPRMRGALRNHTLAVSPVRIIPADAGSTCARARHERWCQDHPRGCGEHPCRIQ